MPLRTDKDFTRRFEHELLARGLTFGEFEARHCLPSQLCAKLARGRVSLRHERMPEFKQALALEGIDPARGLERVRRNGRDSDGRGRLLTVRYHGQRVAAAVIARLGLSYSELARLTRLPRATAHHLCAGYTLGRKRRPGDGRGDGRRERIAAVLKRRGATENELATLWEPLGQVPEADADDGLPPELRRLLKGARPMLGEEVLERFGLANDPFPRWTREGEEPFRGKFQRRALKRLRRAVDRQELVAIVGPVGSGKSELWKCFKRERLEAEPGRYRFAELHSLSQARVTEKQVAEVLLDEVWGRPCPSERHRREKVLREHLKKEADQGRVVTLVIEEGHLVTDELLKVVKSLDEMCDAWSKLVGVVLIAQLQLHRQLKSQALEEVRRRLPVIEYPGLHHSELGRYLEHKLAYVRTAGARKPVFDGAARVFAAKRYRPVTTTPLGLANVASRAMEVAYRLGRKSVTAEDVEKALLEGDRA